LPKNIETDPNAPILRVVRHIVIHVIYLALSVALYFLMAALGYDLKIHIYFLVVLLAPVVVWIAVLILRKLQAPGRRRGEEQ